MIEEFLWTEAYRPHTVADTILPDNVKARFQQYVNDGAVPNLLLAGSAGTGKTTIARAMLEELDCDYIVINGSLNMGIDMLRENITRFASTVSMTGGRKYVIVDEADGTSQDKVQPAFRNFIEEYSKNCGFIFTCNYPSKIIEPLQSRLQIEEFTIPKSERAKLAMDFSKRCFSILDERNVEYDKKAVMELVGKCFPDWRKCIGALQKYSANGRIDSGILDHMSTDKFKDLMGFLKDKKYGDARKWVSEHFDGDSSFMYNTLYEQASTFFTKNTVPLSILILAKYQSYDGAVPNKELNLMACLTELMMESEFV